ncbi:MAG TPA: beta-propeller fold lactonase family protein [Candidatus Cybelea sp.]|nr:beta-propeller fold lactonase family protein [Candidatus Cybelea sp.]
MSFRQIAAAFLAAALLGAGSRPAPLITYSAPAGLRPAGADRIDPADGILPNGRIVAPAGTSLLVGTGALGMALSPDGRFAILSGTSSLSVVNVETMKLASTYQSPASFFMGVAATRDPQDPARTIVLASDPAAGAVDVFDLDASGALSAQTALKLPAEAQSRAFPAQIALSPDDRTAYVADNLGNAVIQVDLSTRTVTQAIPAGDFPLYLAAARDRVLATGSGLSTYAALAQPTREPNFAAPAFDPSKSSALSVFEFSPGSATVDPVTVPMDPAPDGAQVVGGAAPGAVVLSKDDRVAYVALSNVDRVAVVSLAGAPRVVRGLDLRLYPGAPYGAAPSAEALSPDGKRLYVALAGLNAVAVLDARRSTRYRFGLIPTAWYPTAIELSANGRYLYVANAKGAGDQAILQRVDLKHTSLVKATLAALRYNRTPGLAKFDPVVPPLRSNKRSDVIDHVVYIAVGKHGYDAMLGDLKDDAGAPHGNGDPALSLYPQSSTPNLHALARTYALADNFYASDADLNVAKQLATASGATLYQQLVDAANAARSPRNDHGDDPEDYGRGGYLFNAFARAGLTYRDYGGLLRLSGYDGSLYHLDVPALAALAGNVDLDYAGYNPKVGDMARADEFVRDMQQFVAGDRVPSFTYVWIPTDGGRTGVSDADAALGQIVDFISHTPHWSSTVIFVVPEGVESPDDHVSAMRSYALVVSPLARRGYVGDQNLSIASIVKTEEEIFGLPPLALNDLLASDMASFFTQAPAPETYQAQ